jgi:uncharacterized protein YdaU (DUF1376 family)
LNYYERHIGDYIKDTAHLSLLEHGIYSRLLDVYYTRECGIPSNQASRLVGARSNEELAALEIVLREFFDLDGETWVQKRCDEVIAAHHEFIERQKAAGRASAAKRSSNSGSTQDEPPLLNGSDRATTGVQPPTSHSPLPNIESTPTKRGRKKSVLQPLPDDFALTPELARFAAANLPDANVTEMFEAFRGKAIAKGWKYANWPRAWQEFVRNARKDSGHFAAGQYPKREEGKWM